MYTNAKHTHTHITNSQKGRNYFNFECAFHVTIVVGFSFNFSQDTECSFQILLIGRFVDFCTLQNVFVAFFLLNCSMHFFTTCFLITSYLRPNINKFNAWFDCILYLLFINYIYLHFSHHTINSNSDWIHNWIIL